MVGQYRPEAGAAQVVFGPKAHARISTASFRISGSDF